MTTQDEPAVRAVIDAFIDSWNRHDMKSLAALFAEDADFVDVFGNWFKDRMAIEIALTQRHATVFRNSRFTEKNVAVRFRRPDLAIGHATIELSGASDRQEAETGCQLLTLWVAADDRHWDAFAKLLADGVVYEGPQTREPFAA